MSPFIFCREKKWLQKKSDYKRKKKPLVAKFAVAFTRMMADIHPSKLSIYLVWVPGSWILLTFLLLSLEGILAYRQSYEGMSSVHWAPYWAVIELVCVITSFYVEGKYRFFFFFNCGRFFLFTILSLLCLHIGFISQ